jgi:hypothetical protein
LRLTGGALAARRIGGDPRPLGRHAELTLVELERVRVGVVEFPGFRLALHPEVRVVVEEPSEDRGAVLAVSRRVEDVLVPNLVDELARNDLCIGVGEVQRQKPAVLLLHQVEFLASKAPALPWIGELHPDVAQVEHVVEAGEGVRRGDGSDNSGCHV